MVEAKISWWNLRLYVAMTITIVIMIMAVEKHNVVSWYLIVTHAWSVLKRDLGIQDCAIRKEAEAGAVEVGATAGDNKVMNMCMDRCGLYKVILFCETGKPNSNTKNQLRVTIIWGWFLQFIHVDYPTHAWWSCGFPNQYHRYCCVWNFGDSKGINSWYCRRRKLKMKKAQLWT